MQIHKIPHRRLIGAAAVACAAALIPAGALAATGASSAPRPRPVRPVTAYVEGSGVTPINTVTN
jgi:hypothetical protein